VVTYFLITKSMDFKGDTYVETSPATADGKKPRKVTGGVEKRASLLVLYWEDGRFKTVGTKQFSTETPRAVDSQFATTMAPSINRPISEWILQLPRE
jgi:hypothetical protein